MAAVVVNPFMKLSMVLADKAAAATRGAPGAIDINPPMSAMLVPSKEEFTICRPLNASGLDAIFPDNFRNATMEPVKVIPPVYSVRLTFHVTIYDSRGLTYNYAGVCCNKM